jgi:diguanylate cyclase (GGDEF)-like protein/PAS domain S-box-containing protein
MDSVFNDLIYQSQWWPVLVATVFGFFASFAVAGLFRKMHAMAERARRDLAEQHNRLDGALNNMSQGLCMFDAQDNLLVWNQRYVEMYRIAPDKIWAGCTIRDLLNARIAANTFPLDPGKYEAERHEALRHGKSFSKTTDLPDGRCIAVVNQPMPTGGWVATHEDVTERVRAERELSRTRAFLDAVISNVPTPIIVKNVADLRYLLVNKAAEKFFGVDAANLIGKTSHDVFERSLADGIRDRDLAMLSSGQESFFDEHSVTTPAGETRIITVTRLPVKGADGRPQYIISVLHDVTQRKRDEARITYMAHHDTMTDLPNRAAFHECLNAMIDMARASNESFAVLCADVDRFRSINDAFGAGAGDELLRQLSSRLEDACQGAFLARLGGDEFAVISPTGTQPAIAEALAGRLRAAATANYEIDGQSIAASLTFGATIFPTDAQDATGLLANADVALSRAKSEERGTVRFFSIDMDKQLREKRALQHDLRQALANDELQIYYQPQADMEGAIIGFEALVRWRHPRHGMVPPSTFIPLAEESGLIMTLGEWVLREACKEAAGWPKPLRIAVNLSPMQFQHGELANLIHQTLLETGLSPSRLEIEITEGVLIGDFSRAMAILRRIKNMGVRIAMDDFGTGYSSLSYLQSFPFDKIKIDQVFIANLMTSPQSEAIVRAVIGLGHGLKLPVIAEGVETQAQRDFLAGAGCNAMQGYLIGRPQPIEDYAEIVGRSAREAARLATAS